MAGAGDNGGWTPDGGSPDDLPDLPAEWGVIVIPDDLAELDDEVRAIRAELHLADNPSRWRRFMHRPSMRRVSRAVTATLRAPILIVTLAVLVTLASLFASAWPSASRPPASQRTSGSSTSEGTTPLPALTLLGADGQSVPLRDRLPAVILLIDGCDCSALVAAIIDQVRPEIAVITITAAAPKNGSASTPPTGAAPQAQGKKVWALQDKAGIARSQLNLAPPDGETAAALLVNGDGEIIRTEPRILDVATITPDLARL
jgi:hypothetical protein